MQVLFQHFLHVGPAFTVSEFDRVGGIGFAFDVFCVTLLFFASQSLLVLNCQHCQVLLYFLTEDGFRIIRMSQNKNVQLFEGFFSVDKNKLFNASRISLVFEKHNSNETNMSSFFQLNYTKLVIKTTLSAAWIEVKSFIISSK